MRVPPAMADEAYAWAEKHRLEVKFDQRRHPAPRGQQVGVPADILSATYRGVTVTVDCADFPLRSSALARNWLIFQLAAPHLLTEEAP